MNKNLGIHFKLHPLHFQALGEKTAPPPLRVRGQKVETMLHAIFALKSPKTPKPTDAITWRDGIWESSSSARDAEKSAGRIPDSKSLTI